MAIFEPMTSGTATCIVLCCVLAYCLLSLSLLRKRPKRLWIPVLCLLVLATAFYFEVYDYAAAKAWFPKLVLAVISAMNLFLFRMAVSIGDLSSYFYLTDGLAAPGVRNPEVHLIVLLGLYLSAIWTTSILLIHFLAGRLSSRVWLLFHAPAKSGRRSHVFFGTGPRAIALANSLPKSDRIIFICFPDGNEVPEHLSPLQYFRAVRQASATEERLREQVPGSILLKARKSLSECTGSGLFSELGLKRLGRWAEVERNCFYFLADNPEESLSALMGLPPIAAGVWFSAKREGVARDTDLAAPDNFHLVDASFLVAQTLKADRTLAPVRLVPVVRDAAGEPEGCAGEALQALICGFGDGGQGALSFLYEFGTFVDRDMNELPLSCDVVDAKMDRILPGYLEAHPALDPGRVRFHAANTASDAFRKLLEDRISALHYVFIDLGDDGWSANLAVRVLECAFRHRPSLERFLVVVRLDRPADYRPQLDFFNENYGASPTVRIIGNIRETWTWNNVSGESYLRYAKQFQASYALTSGGDSWEGRQERIRRKDATALSRKMELRRKTDQDFANYFHLTVKDALCPDRLKDSAVADAIPQEYAGVHYTGGDPSVALILDRLAHLEHFRWNASHIMAGYRPGPAKREDLMTHPDIRPYDELSEETKHYDWLVVKTSLEVLEKGL